MMIIRVNPVALELVMLAVNQLEAVAVVTVQEEPQLHHALPASEVTDI